VGKLAGAGHPLVLKSDGFREWSDRFLRAGKQMPAADGIRAELLDVRLLFASGQFRLLGWIDADVEVFVILAGNERDLLECIDHALRDQAAQHRALEITHLDDDGTAIMEKVFEVNGIARLINKRKVFGQRSAEVFVNGDLRGLGNPWRWTIRPIWAERAGGCGRGKQQPA
jgi:hypothetical protein